jgi:hypothetical protein
VAQRTRELPAWLQKENTAPDVYDNTIILVTLTTLYLVSYMCVCMYLEQVLSESGGII